MSKQSQLFAMIAAIGMTVDLTCTAMAAKPGDAKDADG